jgi:ketosteroid isomerase-like protein
MNNVRIIQEYFQRFFSGPARHSEVREYLSEDFVFRGPLMKADTAADYINQITSTGDELEMVARVRQLIGQGDSVAALVEFQGPGGPMTYAQWFELRDGKISRLEVVYDPRPFLGLSPDA